MSTGAKKIFFDFYCDDHESHQFYGCTMFGFRVTSVLKSFFLDLYFTENFLGFYFLIYRTFFNPFRIGTFELLSLPGGGGYIAPCIIGSSYFWNLKFGRDVQEDPI